MVDFEIPHSLLISIGVLPTLKFIDIEHIDYEHLTLWFNLFNVNYHRLLKSKIENFKLCQDFSVFVVNNKNKFH